MLQSMVNNVHSSHAQKKGTFLRKTSKVSKNRGIEEAKITKEI